MMSKRVVPETRVQVRDVDARTPVTHPPGMSPSPGIVIVELPAINTNRYKCRWGDTESKALRLDLG